MSTPAPHSIAATRCLECHTFLDSVGSLEPGRQEPRAGEPVACLRCGAVMTYEAGRLRGFTDAEMDALTNDAECMDELARLVSCIHLLKHAEN